MRSNPCLEIKLISYLKKKFQRYSKKTLYSTRIMEKGHSELVLWQLSQKLLGDNENKQFKYFFTEFQRNHSVPMLCTRLKPLINTSERLVLLVEMSYLVPNHLSDDYHRICSLEFANYSQALQACRPGTLPRTERSRVIAQDSSGKTRIVSQGNLKKLIINRSPDLQSSNRSSSMHNSNKSYDEFDDAVESVFLDNNISPKSHRKFEDYNNMRNWQEADLRTDSRRSSGRNYNNGIRYKKDEVTVYEDKGLTISKISNNPGELGKRTHLVHLVRQSGNCSLGMSLKGGIDENTPISVDWVEEGSLADMQGLRRGDHILEVNGHDFRYITHEAAVKIMLLATEMNILVDSSFAGSLREVSNQSLIHDYREENAIIYPSPQGRIGCVITRDGFSANEVIVKKVMANSPASSAGLNVGDHILKIDGIDVSLLTEKQIISLMTSSKKVKLTLTRSHRNGDDLAFSSTRSSMDFHHDRPFHMSRTYSSEHLYPSYSGSDYGAYGHNYPRSPKMMKHLSSSQPHMWYHKSTTTSRSDLSSPSRSFRPISANIPRASPNANYLRAVSSHFDDMHLSNSYSYYDPHLGSPMTKFPGRIYQSRSLSNLNRPFQREDYARKYKYKNAKHNSNSQHFFADDSWPLY
ncbi:uncharacterized protein LOC115221606 isoform X3 [Octopus sinensis]|uniref:Uncharacterized protein LOC115221606 isoform X3 n=1 Tax=Octopus sinensis TaxID=2607531 RepID=A0A7E6FGD8_9MOLL|nr:uncharacterized protein LOC115221606 isoform X3 [Octopus sinensis]